MDRRPKQGGSAYRPDIDGLRAIAVLSVILFHLDKRLLPGGFVGVDVFFVLSGFLITTHILEDVTRQAFSITGFYSRRIKRIAPAMLVVVGLTLLVAKVWMTPEDAGDASKSGVWSLSSLANVFFWRYQDTGYFAAQGKDLPLLHLWSLGVEEQFYIIWPILLMVLYRVERARAFLIGMTVVALGSFALGNILFSTSPAFVYYMLPTRAGELLLGAMAGNAVLKQYWSALPRRVERLLVVVGAVLLAASLLFLSEESVFPGVLAIPSTLGTALLIAGGREGSLTTRILSLKPLTWVGLISYSAYLWHWPLLTFYRYGYGDVGLAAGVALFVLTMTLAWLSYRYVEQPARRSKASFERILIRQYLAPASVIGTFALTVIYAERVWPSLRETPYRRQLATMRAEMRPAYDYPYVCQRQRLEVADVTDRNCIVGPESTGEPPIVLWGDSNAAHYIGVLGTFAREAGFRFRNVEVGSCPPLSIDPKDFVDPRREGDCVASWRVIRPVLDRATVVIVSGSWTDYQRHSPRFLQTFYETVRELTRSGKQVIVLGKAPVLAGFDRRCREKALTFPLVKCPRIERPLVAEVAATNAELQRFAIETPHVRYFDANSYLCHDGMCSTNGKNGDLLYYDPGHLSLVGSWKLGELIVRSDGVPDQFAGLDGGRKTTSVDGSEAARLLASRRPNPGM